ncbi:MAG: DUF3341 domain-containing protein [Bacteroidia bacterium]|nr:DUF3341 domain-containing protein [Bacteroidia bacterium]MCZ2277898.1 DUF3341 domain-containing protein [Bacteroidia bacterium]
MSNKKLIYGVFDEEDVLMKTIKTLKENGIAVKDVISPYPVHGMDNALGLNRTRISICCFLYGITGTCLAFLMMWYMNIFDWPMDIGGKPSFAFYKNLPAFIPVTFETTVLCAAHGMVITFYLRSKLLPGVEPQVIHPRQADDYFVMKVETEESNLVTVEKMLADSGAVEIKY